MGATEDGKTVGRIFFEDTMVTQPDHRRLFLSWFHRECGVDMALAERDCLEHQGGGYSDVASSNGPMSNHTSAFYDWLLSVDPSKALLAYAKVFEENYDTVAQVMRTYTIRSYKGNSLDARMFQDVGIRDVKHQHVFQTWFERCESHDAGGNSLPHANGYPLNGRSNGINSNSTMHSTSSAASTSPEFEAWVQSHHLECFVVALRKASYDELAKLVDLTHESLEDLLDAMRISLPTERAQLRRAVASLWAQEMSWN